MNAVRGRVRGDHVEIDEPLPDGAEVVVVMGATLTREDRMRIDAARSSDPSTWIAHADVMRELDDRKRAGK